MIRLLPILCAAALAGAGASANGGAAQMTYGTNAVRAVAPSQVSSNWSGYVLTSSDPITDVVFSDVTGTWKQPKVSCSSRRRDAVAFWVGLGGNSESSQALEQLGTAAECDGVSRKPAYSVWWEIIPAASVDVKMKLNPGDTVTAAVLVNGNRVTMSVKNVTRGTRFTKSVTVPVVDTASAEWIAEAPSSCTSAGKCRVVPLTKFGTVTFGKAAAIGDGAPATLSNPAWMLTPITLVTDNTASGLFGDQSSGAKGVGAVPGDVTADGRRFSVTWQQNVSG